MFIELKYDSLLNLDVHESIIALNLRMLALENYMSFILVKQKLSILSMSCKSTVQ